MFRSFFRALVLIAVAGIPAVAEEYKFPALEQASNGNLLVVYSSLDIGEAEPLVREFQKDYPELTISYHELQTLEIYERVTRESDSGGKTADLIISSAMDLQMKLANDGYARTINIDAIEGWPGWARWRNTAFALTFEPAVMIFHKPSFKDFEVPRTRAALEQFLKANNNDFFGRIATYDIERAGLGFLLLARDEEHYRDIWDLVQAMSSSGVKLFSKSSAILQRVSDGRSALGYNILGSYARSWAEHNPDLGIILPTDHTVVMSRIALVPLSASTPQAGIRLLSFLMSKKGQEVIANQSGIRALHPGLSEENTASELRKKVGLQLRPIPISPGLLVYLDQVKRSRLIERWNKALQER